ncbi:MAG: FkbM family methyltransferase [Actinomycetes bacterium]
MKVSYAQNSEDVMLWRALGHVRDGFWVDIGAAWPVEDSVTKWFSLRGWRGINVEPNPRLHAMLVDDRPRDLNLACAVADRAGTMTLEMMSETGLSTLDTELAGTYRREGRVVESIDVPVLTLAEILGRHVPDDQEIHFLKIDVEGFEAPVVEGNDWSVKRPWIVVVEATRPSTQIVTVEYEQTLLDAGYHTVYHDGLNRFYVADEHADLDRSFSSPPNVFDGFVSAAYIATEERAAAMEVAALEDRHRADVAVAEVERLRDEVAWMRSGWDVTLGQLDDAHRASMAAQRELGNAREVLHDRERALARVTQDLLAAQHFVAEADGEIRRRDGRIAELEQHLAGVGPHITSLEQYVANLEQHVANLERHIGDLYASTSWRFAKPVRVVSILVRDPKAVVDRLLRRRPQDGSPDSAAKPAVETPSLDPSPEGSRVDPGAAPRPAEAVTAIARAIGLAADEAAQEPLQ